MSIRSLAPTIARVILGLAFFVFGLNFFLHFLPQPAPPPDAGAFLGALVTGKILTVIKVVEVTAGLLLIVGRFVPLALVLLAPVEIGILMFHGVFEPSGLPLPIVLIALTVYLAYAYRNAFAPMLQSTAQPVA
ncbi:MAG TPA: hypothetical protein VGC42_31990 [Kofleriaceae bacterium]